MFAAPPLWAASMISPEYVSKLIHQPSLTAGMMLAGAGGAFVLGAAHALTPGHGKTIVAAYLVGSRGTLKHAAFLGAMVTFTHTITVFVLGLATLALFQYAVPAKATPVLGAISGISIVAIGAWMLYKRIRGVHHHGHEHHGHGHHHHHAHTHAHDHEHTHDHGHGHVHSHVPDEISWASLAALGASGGLVPCESALVLLLSAIALGRVVFGLFLLIAFSAGFAIVLMGIGVLVLYARDLIPDRRRGGFRILQWMPIVSGVVVLCVGVLITAISLGWIQPKWMLG